MGKKGKGKKGGKKQVQESEAVMKLMNRSGFDKKELLSMMDKFKQIAGDDDQIDVAEFKSLFSATMGVEVDMAERLFYAADASGDGRLEFREFLSLAATMQNGTFDEKLEVLFNIYDTDKQGGISRAEMYSLLENMSALASDNEKLGDEEIVRLVGLAFKEMDLNFDDMISLDECKAAVLKDPSVLKRYFYDFFPIDEEQIKAAEKVKEQKKEEMKQLFEQFDKDSSGSIDVKELAALFQHLGVAANKGTEELQKYCERQLSLADANDDGVLGFEEFLKVPAFRFRMSIASEMTKASQVQVVDKATDALKQRLAAYTKEVKRTNKQIYPMMNKSEEKQEEFTKDTIALLTNRSLVQQLLKGFGVTQWTFELVNMVQKHVALEDNEQICDAVMADQAIHKMLMVEPPKVDFALTGVEIEI